MIDQLTIRPLSLSDSRAELEIVGVGGPLAGYLEGPTCAFARTLPARHPVVTERGAGGDTARSTVVVTDPCYWTPSLPFLYELKLRRPEVDDERLEARRLAIRRLFPAPRTPRPSSGGAAFYLESRRFVFRGVCVREATPDVLRAAHSAEIALMVKSPDAETCAAASAEGVFVIADLRSADNEVDALPWVAWQPSVAMVLLQRAAIVAQSNQWRQRGLWIAQSIDPATDTTAAALDARADAAVVELQADQRPPAWLATCGKPVIAIRPGETYADFGETRAACDRLQAELSPEFDLAGYFA